MTDESWTIDEPEDPGTVSVPDPPITPAEPVAVPDFPPMTLDE